MPKQKHKDHQKNHDQEDDYEDIESEYDTSPYCYAANLQLTNRDERGIGKKITALYTRAHQFIMSNPPRADPKVDPLGPATSHGNEPSKGAKIDAELKREDEELLKRKGKA